ncbi:MAG: Gfo/Idh/MocA family oxidoreductase, partial [Chloroflexi bacterium]|nr:Gfo/Idh/MocA family oxidoreductase [Chloroflexota bacterium]
MAKKVRMAIVGCGAISRACGPGYVTNPNAEVVALCDPVRERAEARAKEWGISPKIYTKYEDVLNDPNVDALELLTPTHMHMQQSIDALEAGKHVSCQKPISKNIEEAERIGKAAKKARKIFRVTENFLYYPPIVKAKELLDSGIIGEPSMIRARTVTGKDIGYPFIDVEEDALTWRRNPQHNPGGLIYDSGWHRFSTAIWWGGPIQDITGYITKSDDFMAEAPAAFTWRYQNGNCLGILEDVSAPEIEIRGKYYQVDDFFEISGSKGIIWVTRCTGELLDLPPVMVIKGGVCQGIQVPMDWIDGFNGAAAAFVEAVRTEEQPMMDVAFSKQVLQ